MFRLIKSEIIKGYFFLKLLLIVLWIALVRFFVLLFLTPGRLTSSLEEGQLKYIIFALLLLGALSIWGIRYVFGGFRCVPYWGKHFSAFELARLMRGEVFETVDILGLPGIKNIKVSENWVMVDNHYFYKPLSGQFSLLRSRSRAYYTTWGHYTAIDGGETESISMTFKDGAQPGVAKQISIMVTSLLGIDCNEPYHNTSEISREAFKKVWGDRSYKELLKTDMKQLKQQWLREIRPV